ncbi:MAG: NfeD family protein [Flavobacteriales bacterium]|jgi:membrane protein implicated in regulation of membrane protease activity
MIYDPWHLWAIASLILLIGEIFVPGMILGCLAVGALGGMVGDLFGLAWEGQTIAASVTTILAFVFLRPFAMKHLFHGEGLKTGVDALIGKTAIVTTDFNTKSGFGRCSIDGDDWKAKQETKETILTKGDIVKIVAVNSTILLVNKQ